MRDSWREIFVVMEMPCMLTEVVVCKSTFVIQCHRPDMYPCQCPDFDIIL